MLRTMALMLVGFTIGSLSEARSMTYVVLADGTGDFPTIQAAIDGASGGDTIELGNGLFRGSGNRDVLCGGKALTVRSMSDDPGLCVIDCEGSASSKHGGFTFRSATPGATLLQGITIAHAYTSSHGAGLKCDGPGERTFINCVLSGNTDEDFGGGVYCSGSGAPLFQDCRFEGNAAFAGGGAYSIDASPRFERCVFIGNSAAGIGGGCCLVGESSAEFINCIFSRNASQAAGGLTSGEGSVAIVRNCTFSGNSSAMVQYGSALDMTDLSAFAIENTIVAFNDGAPGITCRMGAAVTLTCSDIFGNEQSDWVQAIAEQFGLNGNVCVDPQFCSPTPDEHENWSLQSDSPCAPGQSACELIGAIDVGCQATAARNLNWGGLKVLFAK